MKHTFCESFAVRRTTWTWWKMMLCEIDILIIIMGYKIHCDRICYFFSFLFFFQWPSWNQRNKAKVLLRWTLFCAFWNAIACSYDVPATNNNIIFHNLFEAWMKLTPCARTWNHWLKNCKLLENVKNIKARQGDHEHKWLNLLFFKIFGVFP